MSIIGRIREVIERKLRSVGTIVCDVDLSCTKRRGPKEDGAGNTSLYNVALRDIPEVLTGTPGRENPWEDASSGRKGPALHQILLEQLPGPQCMPQQT